MPQSIVSQFKREYALPIELYRQVGTIAERDAIPTNRRWEGLQCYVLSEATTYELKGGIDNTYWSVYGGTDTLATHYRGEYDANTGLPAISDGTGVIGDEYIIVGAASPTNVDFGSGDILVQNGDIILYNGSEYFLKVNNNQTPDLSDYVDRGGFLGTGQDLQDQIDALDQAVILKGSWDASSGSFPGGGVAQAGWKYIVTVSGTVDSIDFQVGDSIIAITDNASTTTYSGNWIKIDNTEANQNLQSVTDLGATTTNAISVLRLTSTQTTGTAPFTVASTTLVTNLNADLLDGIDGSTYARKDQNNNFTADQNITGNLIATEDITAGVNATVTNILNVGVRMRCANDTNTYVGFPSADNLQIVAGGIQRGVFNSGGLQVNGTASGAPPVNGDDFVTLGYAESNFVNSSEGSFTASLSSSVGGAVYTIGTNNCYYIKRGASVQIWIALENISNTGSPSGTFRINGLPFTCDKDAVFSGLITGGASSSSDVDFLASNAGDTFINTRSAGTVASFNPGTFPVSGSIRISGTYYTDE
jgi:hypothetical protein